MKVVALIFSQTEFVVPSVAVGIFRRSVSIAGETTTSRQALL